METILKVKCWTPGMAKEIEGIVRTVNPQAEVTRTGRRLVIVVNGSEAQLDAQRPPNPQVAGSNPA